jgi:hypothetical protein
MRFRENDLRKNRLILLAALELEAKAAARAVGIRFRPNRVLTHPTAAIEVHIIGIRAQRLPQALAAIRPSPGDRFCLVGLAGALDPALRVGDLVVDADPTQPDLPLADESVHWGPIHTSDRLVATPAEKRALFARTAALAVDMEQQIVRTALAGFGAKLLGVRSISDTADTALDPALPGFVDALGRPKWPTLTKALLRRPALLISLARLGRDSSRATRRLTCAIARLAELSKIHSYSPLG